ncbi:MAG TPA: YsnF/AvaK domain-containing protein [Microvirga sp.]|nr:YsnF/AvaK domain-containing protein [Microvirga sp.]
MAKTVTSLFGSESQASSIVRRLEDSGIANGKICLFTEGGSNRFWDGTSDFGDGTEGASHDRVSGFLMRNGVPAGDAHAFSEGVRRGHSLVAVRCDDDEVDAVIRILDGNDTLDLDEHQSTWRSEGWMGHDAGAIGAAGSTTTGMTTGMMGSGTGSSSSMTDTSRRTGDQVIPIAEEELHVGKRETSGGRVRIHSHVIERPVQEQVSLREERVHVERRPAEGTMRAGTVGKDGLFEERTIEMEERSEEAVVAKEARVKEELVVRKDVEQRTETISDTVRSTKVEIEDERGNRISGTGTKRTDR